MDGYAEILGALAAETDRYPELEPTVNGWPVVIKAVEKTAAWVVLVEPNGPIDAPRSLKYAGWLGREGTRPQLDFEGHPTVTLIRACHWDDNPLIHPWLLKAILGPDDFGGHDYANADPMLLRAAIWANATGHRLWAASLDGYKVGQEILAPAAERDGRWDIILRDYLREVEANHGEQLLPSVFWTRSNRAIIDSWLRDRGLTLDSFQSTGSAAGGSGQNAGKVYLSGVGPIDLTESQGVQITLPGGPPSIQVNTFNKNG